MLGGLGMRHAAGCNQVAELNDKLQMQESYLGGVRCCSEEQDPRDRMRRRQDTGAGIAGGTCIWRAHIIDDYHPSLQIECRACCDILCRVPYLASEDAANAVCCSKGDVDGSKQR